MGKTVINASGPGFDMFSINGGVSNVQFWGLDVDCGATTRSAISGDGISNLLIQQVYVKNYASTISGSEDFPIYLFATNHSYSGVLIDSCKFTQASSRNVDGTSVIATGAFRPNGINYSNVTISNCTFDTPTDPGTLYYHCVGSAQMIAGCTFTGPNFSNGGFFWNEPGSWNGSSLFQDNSDNTTVLQGNTVVLQNNNWHFCGLGIHKNGRAESFVINNANNITGGIVFHVVFKDAGYQQPISRSVTIQHNTLSAATMTGNVAPGDIAALVTSPNP
jgi:hypothetical protein